MNAVRVHPLVPSQDQGPARLNLPRAGPLFLL